MPSEHIHRILRKVIATLSSVSPDKRGDAFLIPAGFAAVLFTTPSSVRTHCHHCMESTRISDIARMAGVHRSHLYAEFSRR
ncbi:hypothetical protein [Paenibacillus humicus]|uniref:hypothetical protein n=1 Tax=Paenibacillus humicus TaxID=412861 RepID=UPI000FD9636B|nr:hypothetical protein [Paenibacillus humicus]